jgi:hypothetical protein
MKLSKSVLMWVSLGVLVGGAGGWVGASALASIHFLTAGESQNGWSYYLTLGRNEPPSLAAASAAKHGMFGHVAEEAVYFIESGDASEGQAYALHFDADEFPPVDAFWSLTMYHDDLPYNLVANSIDRFVISDRTPGVRFNDDGSLDIHIQHTRPTPEQASNWLPAPDGPFRMLLRTYITGDEIRDGTYAPPPVQVIASAEGRP